MATEKDDIVVLIDEDGKEEEFEFIDSIEMNGNEYEIFCPLSSNEDDFLDTEIEMVILKVEMDKNGEKSYVTVDDENELDTVFEEFKAKMEDEFIFDIEDGDFEDFDDDDDYDYDSDDDDDDYDGYDDEDYDDDDEDYDE